MRIHVLFFLLVACPEFSFAQSNSVVTFQQGVTITPRSINNQGQIVGYFTSSNSTYPQAFLRSPSGIIQTITLPNAIETRFLGINDLSEIVGTRDGAKAFIRRSDGAIVDITVTDATLVGANAINNNGYVVGVFQRPNTNRLGFLRNLAAQIVPLGDIYPGDVEAVAIANNTDRVVLTQITGGSIRVYLNSPAGNFDLFTPSIPNQPTYNFIPHGITAGGVIVGESNGHGLLVRNPSDGVIFDIPNAISTIPYGINDRNQIVGLIRNADNTQSGFLLNPCSPSISQDARSHGSAAEQGSFDITGDANCLWIADPSASWINLTQSIGNGPGTVRYQLAPNPGPERQGKITIGAREFLISQASSNCHYSVTSMFVEPISAAAALLNFAIGASPGCPWTTYSPSPWVRLVPASGSGNATITAQVDAADLETAVPRTALLNIAGSSVPLTQFPLPCDVTFSRNSISVPAEGSLENIRLIVRAACPWNLYSIPTWISPLLTSGQGTTNLTLRIGSNPGLTERTATINVATPSPTSNYPRFTITQQASPRCTYSFLSSYGYTVDSTVAPAEGFTSSFNLQTGGNCPYAAVSDVDWIQIVTPASPPPTPGISYRVLANPSRLSRRGVIRVGGLVFTVDQLGITTSQLGFVPLTPCRALDTRVPGRSAIPPGAPEYLAISASCGVPQSARAYVLNVTAIPSAPLTFLTITSLYTSAPQTSTLNALDGRTTANLAILPSGALFLVASDTTHAVVDVIGYFADPAPDSLVLYPVTPCRVTDTRTTNTPLTGGSTRNIQIAGTCGVPANAAAVSVNATAIPRGRLDYLTLYPAGRNRPNTSTLNAQTGQVTANAALLATGAGGAITVFATQDTDFALDVNGYFGPPSDTGLYFNVMPPCRMTDTRLPKDAPALAASSTRTFTPASSTACGIPANARAYALNATAVPQAPMAFLSLFPAPTWTGVSTLNAYTGQITANFAIVPENGQGIGALASSPSHLLLDISGYFATVPIDQRRPALPNQ